MFGVIRRLVVHLAPLVWQYVFFSSVLSALVTGLSVLGASWLGVGGFLSGGLVLWVVSRSSWVMDYWMKLGQFYYQILVIPLSRYGVSFVRMVRSRLS